MEARRSSPVWERREGQTNSRIWRKDPLKTYTSLEFTGYVNEIRAITDSVLTPRESTFTTEELRTLRYGTRSLPTPNSTGSSVLKYNSLNASKLARLPDASILKLNLPPNSTASSFYPTLEPNRSSETQSKGDYSGRSRIEKYLLGFVIFLGTLVILLLLLLFLVMSGVVRRSDS